MSTSQLPKPKIFLDNDEGAQSSYSLESCTVVGLRDFLDEMIKLRRGNRMIKLSNRTVGTCTFVVPWHCRYVIIS